jgi:hypothetical protein
VVSDCAETMKDDSRKNIPVISLNIPVQIYVNSSLPDLINFQPKN